MIEPRGAVIFYAYVGAISSLIVCGLLAGEQSSPETFIEWVFAYGFYFFIFFGLYLMWDIVKANFGKRNLKIGKGMWHD